MIRTTNTAAAPRSGFRSLLLSAGVLALAVPVFATWQPAAAPSAPAAGDDPYANGLAILDLSPAVQAARPQPERPPAPPGQGETAVLLRDWSYTADTGNTQHR